MGGSGYQTGWLSLEHGRRRRLHSFHQQRENIPGFDLAFEGLRARPWEQGQLIQSVTMKIWKSDLDVRTSSAEETEDLGDPGGRLCRF